MTDGGRVIMSSLTDGCGQMYRTDTGSVPTCGLSAELVSIGVDGGVYVCRDRPRGVIRCPIPMSIPMPIRSADRITIFLRLTLWFTLLNSFYIAAAGAYAMMSLSCMSFFILLPTYEIQYKM